MPEGQAPASMGTPPHTHTQGLALVILVHLELSAGGKSLCYYLRAPVSGQALAVHLLDTSFYPPQGHFLVQKRGVEPGRDPKVPLSSDSDPVLPISAVLLARKGAWASDRVGERETEKLSTDSL